MLESLGSLWLPLSQTSLVLKSAARKIRGKFTPSLFFHAITYQYSRQAPRPGCHLTMEDVLVSTRRHEDARFPRRAGFRVPKEPPSISRSSTALTGVEAASGNSLQPQGSSTDMMSMAGHASTPSLGHPLHAPPAFLGEQPALSTPWNTSEHVDSSQINFAANEDTMNAFYAQALYDDDGSVGFGISPGVLDSLIGPTMIADERMGFGAFT